MNNIFKYGNLWKHKKETDENFKKRILRNLSEGDMEKEKNIKWENLNKEDQLDIFCTIINKINNAHKTGNCSFRDVLYNEFDFDESSYFEALESGFMDINNAISQYKINNEK